MKGVRLSADLTRIRDLPRRQRDWAEDDASARGFTDLLNDRGLALWRKLEVYDEDTRKKKLTEIAQDPSRAPLQLSGAQYALLDEWRRYRRMASDAPVGVGKTLVLYLMATIAHEEWGDERIAMVLPASLVKDTRAEHRRYARYWRSAPKVTILTYQSLTREENAFLLCGCNKCTEQEDYDNPVRPLEPQVLLFDECHRMKAASRSVPSRVARYKKNHPEVKIAALSGNWYEKSFDEIYHLLHWTLGGLSPLPLDYHTQREWAAATDVKPPRGGRVSARRLTTVLTEKEAPPSKDEIAQARRAVGRRIAETPGFLSIPYSSCDRPLHAAVYAAPDDDKINEALLYFRETGSRPDGVIPTPPLETHAHEGTLGCGYYLVWDPPAPPDWLSARNDYNSSVRQVIKDSRRIKGRLPIETEKQARRFLKDRPEYEAWFAIHKDFTPNSVPVEISRSVIEYAADWAEKHPRGIVWTSGKWEGREISKLTGAPYIEKDGRTLTGGKPVPGRPIIASVQGNKQGRNWWLWNHNLVITPPQNNGWNEQIIGRTHRKLQSEDVFVDYLLTSALSFKALREAITERATANEQVFGRKPKLSTALWDWRVPENVLNPENESLSHQARWLIADEKQTTAC